MIYCKYLVQEDVSPVLVFDHPDYKYYCSKNGIKEIFPSHCPDCPYNSNNFNKYNLQSWQVKDLENINDEYHITEKTDEELDELAQNLYWQADRYSDLISRLETEAMYIKKYITLRKEYGK